MTARPTDAAPLVEPGPAPGWWDETPAEAAAEDRRYFDRDDYDTDEEN